MNDNRLKRLIRTSKHAINTSLPWKRDIKDLDLEFWNERCEEEQIKYKEAIAKIKKDIINENNEKLKPSSFFTWVICVFVFMVFVSQWFPRYIDKQIEKQEAEAHMISK